MFDTGEEVVTGLLQFAKNHKLTGAHLTAIGAFERVTLGFFDVTKKAYKRIAIQEQVEVMSLVGNIAHDGTGDPKPSTRTLSLASGKGSRMAVTCWTLMFDQPWRSW